MKEVDVVPVAVTPAKRKAEFLEGFQDKYKDEFLPQTWDDKMKNRVLELTDAKATKKSIVTAIPMICRAEKCDFHKTCPLFQEGIAPLGEGCPIEFGIVRHFVEEFMTSLDVEPDNLVEMLLIRDMVNQEVQLLRATKILAQESFIQENVVGIDQDGEPIMQKQLHLAADYEDKLFKRRQILFKQFLATRAERMKAGMAVLDSAQTVANLVGSLKKAKRIEDEDLKRKLGIAEEDSYIEAKIREREQPQED